MAELCTTRVYLPFDDIAHQLAPDASPNKADKALCGEVPDWPSLWHGTGDQDEYDTAMILPMCPVCRETRDVP